MEIYGIQKTTLVDFPGHVATTLFTGGCNFRCPYCHNSDLIQGLDKVDPYSTQEVFDHLKKRKGVLDGVVISGGEPTIHPDLPDFIRKVKALGYLVKLDTNGTNPKMLKALVEEGLVDYVAMDIKHSRVKYPTVACNETLDMDAILESVDYLKGDPVDYEFRTTLCVELHRETDITAIGLWLAGAKAYYLQPYKESDQVLQPGFHRHSREKLQDFVTLLSAFVNKVEIRGLD